MKKAMTYNISMQFRWFIFFLLFTFEFNHDVNLVTMLTL